MEKTILICLVSLFSVKVYSQNKAQRDTSLNPSKTLSEYFNKAEVVLGKVKYPPEFPGGKAAWSAFLKSNIDISKPLKNKALPGTFVVSVRYTVGKDGSLKNIGAETGCGYGMEDEVIRCLKLSPAWLPAQTADKEIVNFATRQLVIFKIKGTVIETDIR